MNMARILDGKLCAQTIKNQIAQQVKGLATKPGLGTILVGDDPGSHAYVNGKHRDCAEVGINSIRVDLPASATQFDVLKAVKDLNDAKECTGYIVQLPLPGDIDTNLVLEAIDPDKDADGLHPINLGRLVLNQPAPRPCTPNGIIELLKRNDISWAGKDVAIIGRGTTVGRPLSLMLNSKEINATVTNLHTGSKDLAAHTRRADIVVAAIGQAHFLKAEMIKPGAVVVDVGITRTQTGLQGDVHPDVAQIASAITPMPGGVGPMTRAMLLNNILLIAQAKV
ncbi:MAG: bifunctional methylenetetrahydrofolate dehydrogenase/methenyltetrahydrofolate cyclohydrolase [Candidatus Nanopelagicaceae bacterium]|nr:bifunctional methylenetetrahydrofolate dehydrogenase/methenyltetrahydrofolate cyclohydrolase [Candidatus Nanopelagicaceae bacterium]